MHRINIRAICFIGPSCQEAIPAAGIVSPALNHNQPLPGLARWRSFVGEREVHPQTVRGWCVDTAAKRFRHAFLVGLPHTEGCLQIIREFAAHQLVWVGGVEKAPKNSTIIADPMNVEEVIKHTLRKLPDDHELGARLIQEIEGDRHPARQAINTIMQLRRQGLASVTQPLMT